MVSPVINRNAAGEASLLTIYVSFAHAGANSCPARRARTSPGLPLLT
jgi:hypothetical protein